MRARHSERITKESKEMIFLLEDTRKRMGISKAEMIRRLFISPTTYTNWTNLVWVPCGPTKKRVKDFIEEHNKILDSEGIPDVDTYTSTRLVDFVERARIKRGLRKGVLLQKLQLSGSTYYKIQYKGQIPSPKTIQKMRGFLNENYILQPNSSTSHSLGRKVIEQRIWNRIGREIKDTLKETLKERGMHGCSSIHEILGLVTEEYTEMQYAVMKNQHAEIRSELMDIIIACIMGIVSIESKTIEW